MIYLFIYFVLSISELFSLNIYNLDLESSSLEWIGRKVTGEHDGSINFSSGYVALDGKAIKSGFFNVDMKTIKNLDIENPTYRQYLEDHLNDDDFFSTDSHPLATLEIMANLLQIVLLLA